MKALVFGMGLQGKACVYDLEQNSLFSEIRVFDIQLDQMNAYITKMGFKKVTAKSLDANDKDATADIIRNSGADIVICMLPPAFGYHLADAAIDTGIPYTSSSYPGEIVKLHDKALANNVAVLPEMGMDPGIDLIMGRMAVESLDEVHGMYSYGAGIPETRTADNPLNYKITWTFDGVLTAYMRTAKVMRNGEIIDVPGMDIFKDPNTHEVTVSGLGKLEAYPNGNAVHYASVFGIEKTVRDMGRFALRWPGHCLFWQTMKELGFFDETPMEVNGGSISPKTFLVKHLTPRLQFKDDERDVVILKVDAWGLKDGGKQRVTLELTDYRDLKNGFFAMNRTVGFTTAISASLLLNGSIQGKGVLSPVNDIRPEIVAVELEKRGMRIVKTVS